MHAWMIGAAMNGIILVAYLAISLNIAQRVIGSGQLRSNPLAVATAAIFFTCAVHHGGHTVHMLLPYFDLEKRTGNAMRTSFGEWHTWGWDVLTAGVAVWYFMLRSRFPALVRGAALFEDLRERQRQALDIHDNIVQGLATAKLSFEMDHYDEGMAAVERTLTASRALITGLLGEEGSGVELGPGDLRRRTPAS